MASVTLKLNVWEKSYSVANNTSDIGWSLSVTSVNAYNGYANQCPYVVKYNNSSGSTVSSGNKAFGNNTTTELASGTITGYKHKDDGSGSITLYAHYTTGVSPATASTTTTINLTKINRYAKINSFYVSTTTKESITLKFATDTPINYYQYSLNNGSWLSPSKYATSSDYKSGEFTIENLKSDTTYSIKMRVQKTDSGLWTTSSAVNGTTLKAKLIRTKINGTWKETISYVKTNGVWKEATPYIKVNGVWKEGV